MYSLNDTVFASTSTMDVADVISLFNTTPSSRFTDNLTNAFWAATSSFVAVSASACSAEPFAFTALAATNFSLNTFTVASVYNSVFIALADVIALFNSVLFVSAGAIPVYK